MVTLLEKLTADVIAWLPKTVRMVATCSVGTDHIDLAAAKSRGLIVTNTPGAVVEATADIAFLLILAATRRASEGEAMVRSDTWPGWRPTQLLGMGLQGRRLGLVGFGGIGQAVARRALAFGMEVHWHGPGRSPAPTCRRRPYHARLEDLLALSDVLSLHAPSGPETRNLVNAETLALLPPGAVVVNTARGDLVDDDALITALKGGRLMAAGLDVYRGEPALDPRYRTLPNVALLPHLGTATLETRTGMGDALRRKPRRLLRGSRSAEPGGVKGRRKRRQDDRGRAIGAGPARQDQGGGSSSGTSAPSSPAANRKERVCAPHSRHGPARPGHPSRPRGPFV